MYKLGKGALEIGAAAAALFAVTAQGFPIGSHRLLVLHEHLSAKWAHLFDALLSGGTVARMHMVALALAVDGLFSLVEGWSVWRRRSWAPWLIVVATGGLIPLEIVLLAQHPTASHACLLVVNALIVAYMIHSRIRARQPSTATPKPGARMGRRALWKVSVGLLTGYAGLSYLVLPWLVRHWEVARVVQDTPDRAFNGLGQPSDPLNVGLVGTRDDVFGAMQRAGWSPAEALSGASAMGIAEGVLFRRSDPEAPVSSLFLMGRRQDLAFEQQVGGSPRRRHHVRLWLHPASVRGRSFWAGAATYDRGVGLTTTGEFTHEIDPDIDAERDKLVADLVRCRCATNVHRVPGVGMIPPQHGARVHTDGLAAVAVLAGAPVRDRGEALDSP